MRKITGILINTDNNVMASGGGGGTVLADVEAIDLGTMTGVIKRLRFLPSRLFLKMMLPMLVVLLEMTICVTIT